MMMMMMMMSIIEYADNGHDDGDAITRLTTVKFTDAAGLRRLIQVKNKELKHMKGLAATILTQRTGISR